MTQIEDRMFLLHLLEDLIAEEKRGQKFFIEAARMVPGLREKNLLEKLAIDEAEHVDILLKEHKDLLEQEDTVSHRPGTGRKITHDLGTELFSTYEVYTEEMASRLPEIDFFRVENFQDLLADCSPGTILKLAMQIEFDNFKYLVNLARHMKTRKGVQTILRLADEEKQHFILLRRRYDKLPPNLRATKKP